MLNTRFFLCFSFSVLFVLLILSIMHLNILSACIASVSADLDPTIRILKQNRTKTLINTAHYLTFVIHHRSHWFCAHYWSLSSSTGRSLLCIGHLWSQPCFNPVINILILTDRLLLWCSVELAFLFSVADQSFWCCSIRICKCPRYQQSQKFIYNGFCALCTFCFFALFFQPMLMQCVCLINVCFFYF